MPFFMQLEWKMSAKDEEMMQRIPIPEMDHGACSRDEPHPKFGPATRIHASWYCGWLRTKSSFGRAISGPIVATSTGLWYRISAKAAKPSPVLLIVLRNSFGMIRSVSTFGMFSGAAAPRTTVKRGMPPPPPPPLLAIFLSPEISDDSSLAPWYVSGLRLFEPKTWIDGYPFTPYFRASAPSVVASTTTSLMVPGESAFVAFFHAGLSALQ
mmetsp:Transcript_4939/g.16491  ORF Transcript_4939/g.16491 Transcript_4939/m.16491 type:complete len:211 (+) Transcript_4939:630-1262(+)